VKLRAAVLAGQTLFREENARIAWVQPEDVRHFRQFGTLDVMP
jgi:hypothetical protein